MPAWATAPSPRRAARGPLGLERVDRRRLQRGALTRAAPARPRRGDGSSAALTTRTIVLSRIAPHDPVIEPVHRRLSTTLRHCHRPHAEGFGAQDPVHELAALEPGEKPPRDRTPTGGRAPTRTSAPAPGRARTEPVPAASGSSGLTNCSMRSHRHVQPGIPLERGQQSPQGAGPATRSSASRNARNAPDASAAPPLRARATLAVRLAHVTDRRAHGLHHLAGAVRRTVIDEDDLETIASPAGGRCRIVSAT